MNRHKTEVLRIGWRTRGYQLGSGIQRGWKNAKLWMDTIEERYGHPITHYTEWGVTRFICPDCDTPISKIIVPAPLYLVIFQCTLGHKFCYENVD